MIDFRYHLVSIVAVLLALSIGIVLGTGTLGGPLLQNLENNVDELRADNQERREEVAALNEQLAAERGFTEAAEPFMVDGSLTGRDVVIVEFAGTDGAIASRLRGLIAAAGGNPTTTVEILNKFALEDDISRDELALAIGSVAGERPELLAEAAQVLGETMGSAAAGNVSGSTALLEELQSAGFVDIEREGDPEGPLVPEGSSFMIVGGSPDEPRYDVSLFTLNLVLELTATEAAALAAEPSTSMWGIVQIIRNDGDARDEVATADTVEQVSGRVPAILGLERAIEGNVDHYGTGPGAELILPEPPGEE
jgi:hypothetical protein